MCDYNYTLTDAELVEETFVSSSNCSNWINLKTLLLVRLFFSSYFLLVVSWFHECSHLLLFKVKLHFILDDCDFKSFFMITLL